MRERAACRKWATAAVVAAGAAALCAAGARAAAVSDFFTLKATPATTLSGTGNTDDPSLGTVAITSSAARLIGYFTPQTLVDVGDKITLTFSMTLNDAATYGTAGDNFRFALFDRSLEANSEATNSNLAVVGTDNTDQFRGYWFGTKTGSGAAPNGSIRERSLVDGTEDDPFTNNSTTGTTSLGPAGGTNVVFTGAVNGVGTAPVYTGVMTITKTASGVDLSGSFSGSNGGANSFAFSDTTPIASTFGAVGFLNGGALSIDQINFSNVDVTFTPIPEPAALALLGLGGLLALRRRRGVV